MNLSKYENDDIVVNNELKVRGIKNLRVADGSIMPYITSGNTNAPIMFIAEIASEIILNSYKN